MTPYDMEKLIDVEKNKTEEYTKGVCGTCFGKRHRTAGIGTSRHLIQDSYGYTLEELEQFEYNATQQVKN